MLIKEFAEHRRCTVTVPVDEELCPNPRTPSDHEIGLFQARQGCKTLSLSKSLDLSGSGYARGVNNNSCEISDLHVRWTDKDASIVICGNGTTQEATLILYDALGLFGIQPHSLRDMAPKVVFATKIEVELDEDLCEVLLSSFCWLVQNRNGDLDRLYEGRSGQWPPKGSGPIGVPESQFAVCESSVVENALVHPENIDLAILLPDPSGVRRLFSIRFDQKDDVPDAHRYSIDSDFTFEGLTWLFRSMGFVFKDATVTNANETEKVPTQNGALRKEDA